jgi:hypothetical protein
MQRVCQCGAVLSSMYRGKICRDCREKAKFLKRSKIHQDNVKSWQDLGCIQVHSCLGNIADKVASDFCACKKFVSKSRASELVSKGLAVDFETRMPMFVNRDIVLKKSLRTPRAATIDRVQIQQAWASESIKPIERSPEELRQFIAEDKQARAYEERVRIEIYNELTQETWQSLIRIVPAEEYDALKASQIDSPVIWAGIGDDSRTAGGIGLTVYSTQMPNAENEMYEEDEGHAPPITETEDDETIREPEAGNDEFYGDVESSDQDIDSDEYLSGHAIVSDADGSDEFQQADDEEIAAA